MPSRSPGKAAQRGGEGSMGWSEQQSCMPSLPSHHQRDISEQNGWCCLFLSPHSLFGFLCGDFPLLCIKRIRVGLCRISSVQFPAPPLPNGSLLSLILGMGPTNCNVVLSLLSLPFRYPLHAFHMASCAASALSCRVRGPHAY